MKKIIKYVLVALEISVLFVAIGAITTAITKNVYSDILIARFKSRAKLDIEESTEMTKIYRIKSNETIKTYQKMGDDYFPGNTGDILISRVSELEIPFVHEVISFFAGGHATLVLGNYQDCYERSSNYNILESTGLADGENLSIVNDKYYWITDEPYKEVICLRVKATSEQRKKVNMTAMALVGDPYNYSFLYDTKNKSYCSDIVNKAYHSIGVNLNKDGFTTSIYDLILSGETYISYYHYFDNDGVKHIYFLD